ncbi:Uncharacterised protein [Mycobacterium tuberculosis]|nr:Uncharacterised protein [Mycobacterium tuberculosis]CKV34721.1 Uncharacterised protein [Mycobacterium tuberculosis]
MCLPLLLTQLVSQVISTPKISMSMEIVSVKLAQLSSKIVAIYLKTVSFWQSQLLTSNRR